MRGKIRSKRRVLGWMAALVAVSVPAITLAQGRANERSTRWLYRSISRTSGRLHFRYKPPRIATVEAIGKDGKKVQKTVWYLWYQIYNRSGEPQTCLPEFELVTKDLNTTHLDEPQPYIFEQLKKREDTTISKELPNGIYDFKTIGISKRPIPPTLPDSVPRVVSGLAIWTDMAEKAPRPTSSRSTSLVCRMGWPSRRRPRARS